MASYEEYLLQIHQNHDYYGLILMHSKASDLAIRCGLNKISRIIFPGYECSNAFYRKQWTDFCKIHTILMNRIQRNKYNYYRKDAVKLDINVIKLLDIWKPYSNPNVCISNYPCTDY